MSQEKMTETQTNQEPNRSRLFRFGLAPWHWFLKGQVREIARTEYYYEGALLKRQLKKIGVTNKLDIDEIDVEFDFDEGKISRYEYRKQMLDIETIRDQDALAKQEAKGLITKTEYKEKVRKLEEQKRLSELEIDYKEGLLSDNEHQKAKANYLKEPWVNVVNVDMNEDNPKAGEFELDWNDEFVKYLQENGYTGPSDETIINEWFNDVCRTVLIQEAQDQDFGLEERFPDINNRDDVEIIRDDPPAAPKETKDE